MKSQAVRAVFHLVLGLIVLAVMIYILANVPKKVGAISSFFDTLFGWLSPKPSQVDKAILCSFYRCYSGCDNLPDDVANYEINYRGETVKCKDFCRKDLVNFFDIYDKDGNENSDGRICGRESDMFPVEFTPDFGKRGWEEFSTSFLKETFNCVLNDMSTDWKVNGGEAKAVVIYPAECEEEDNECGEKGIRRYKLPISNNIFREYFVTTSYVPPSPPPWWCSIVNPLFCLLGAEVHVPTYWTLVMEGIYGVLTPGSIIPNNAFIDYDCNGKSVTTKTYIHRFSGYIKDKDKYFDAGMKSKAEIAYNDIFGFQKAKAEISLAAFSLKDGILNTWKHTLDYLPNWPKYTIYYNGFAFKDISLNVKLETDNLGLSRIKHIKLNGSVELCPNDCSYNSKEDCLMDACCEWENGKCKPAYGKVFENYYLEIPNSNHLFQNPYIVETIKNGNEEEKIKIWNVHCRNSKCSQIDVFYNFSSTSGDSTKLYHVVIEKGKKKVVISPLSYYSIFFEKATKSNNGFEVMLKIERRDPYYLPTVDCRSFYTEKNCKAAGCCYGCAPEESSVCWYWNTLNSKR